jgi:hypothetical protein
MIGRQCQLADGRGARHQLALPFLGDRRIRATPSGSRSARIASATRRPRRVDAEASNACDAARRDQRRAAQATRGIGTPRSSWSGAICA